MNPTAIGLRCQDFHESLRNTTAAGTKDVHFLKTLKLGKAASLAMHLRGLPYVSDAVQLQYAASSLGIGGLELEAVLKELEAVDFVSVTRSSTDEIKRVDVRVPVFRSGYEVLGQRWLELKPTEIEQAGVNTLELLHQGPLLQHALLSSLSVDSKQFGLLNDVMKAGQLIATHTLDSEKYVFTPLAIDGNPTAYLRWAKDFPQEVNEVLQTLRNQQGIAGTNALMKSNPAVVAAVTSGIFLPVEVNGATGVQRFYFAPQGSLNQYERTVLDKARAIVSCVRYGQGFSAGTRIRYPRALINTLMTNKRFNKAHPDVGTQYGIFVEKLIGFPVRSGSGWNLEINDTPENMHAFRVALELLEHGEAPSTKLDSEAHKALTSPQCYVNPLTARPQLGTAIALSAEGQEEMVYHLSRLVRGMNSYE